MPSSDRFGFELVTVQSGARSLRSREHGEIFHPVVGPMAEARVLHVAQQRLVERAREAEGTFVIWDVGLGAAANAVAVLEAFGDDASSDERFVELHSFDQTTAGLVFALMHAGELEYLERFEQPIRELIATSHTIAGRVCWHLHAGDFQDLVQSGNLPSPHAILYDPYSPRANPGMWTLEHFRNVRARIGDAAPCLLTNYTRSTAVRVTLLLAGFHVGRGEGIGEKEETTIAANDSSLLRCPLDSTWLERARGSTRSGPLRIVGGAAILNVEEWAELGRHPQFAAPRN